MTTSLNPSTFLLLLRLCWYAASLVLMAKVMIIINRWRVYHLQDEDLAEAWEGLKLLLVRGRKETELLLSGDYGRRVAVGYVFKDLAKFSEGQSYLNVYVRSRTKAAAERAMAEWDDRRSRRKDSGTSAEQS